MKKLLFMMMIASNLNAMNSWQALEEIDEQVRARENMPARVYDVQVVNKTERRESSVQDIFRENREATIHKICFPYFSVLKMVPDLQLLPLLPDVANAIVCCVKMMAVTMSIEDFEETPDSIL